MIYLTKPSRGHITQFFAATQVDGNPHAGQDYAYSRGAEIFPEVYAAADGVVLFAGDSRGLSWPNIMYLNPDFDRSDAQDSSAGNYTILAHFDAAGNQVALTGYGHQEEIWVSAGQSVKAGQRIGTVGATGFSAGKHLHFDLVLAPFDVDDAPYYGRVDPNPYIIGEWNYAGDITQQGTTTDPTPNLGDKMLVLATNGTEPQVWAGDGILRRPIWTLDTMSAAQWLATNKVLGPFYKDGEVQTIPDLNSIGIDVMGLVGKGVNG